MVRYIAGMIPVFTLLTAVLLAVPHFVTKWIEATGQTRSSACAAAKENCVQWGGKLKEAEDPCECRQLDYGGYGCNVRCVFLQRDDGK